MHADREGRARRSPTTHQDRRTVLSGFLFGCGIAASVIDLFIFHLALHWHHFYDLSTTSVALVSDGFFHAFGWFITVWGLFLLADVRRRTSISWARWAGAVTVGVGFFQLFDGIVNHKLLRIHQIRYEVDLLPYDTVWIGSALILLAVGAAILWRSSRHRDVRATAGSDRQPGAAETTGAAETPGTTGTPGPTGN